MQSHSHKHTHHTYKIHILKIEILFFRTSTVEITNFAKNVRLIIPMKKKIPGWSFASVIIHIILIIALRLCWSVSVIFGVFPQHMGLNNNNNNEIMVRTVQIMPCDRYNACSLYWAHIFVLDLGVGRFLNWVTTWSLLRVVKFVEERGLERNSRGSNLLEDF